MKITGYNVYLYMIKELSNIKGLEHLGCYFITDAGAVISRKRKEEVELKGAKNRCGYKMYCLVGDYSGQRWFFSHRLVAAAFMAPPPSDKHEINHIDGDKLNNNLANLEWVTHSENIRKSYENGRKTYKGAEHWNTGKKAKTSTKAAMRNAKLGEKHPKFTGWYVCNYKKFASANQAAKVMKISSGTVIRRCKADKWRLKGWYFVSKS